MAANDWSMMRHGNKKSLNRSLLAFCVASLVLLIADFGFHFAGPSSHHSWADLWWTFRKDAKWLIGGGMLCAIVIYAYCERQKTASGSGTHRKTSEVERNPPLCNVLSLVVPLVGVPLAFVIAQPTEAGWGWGGAMQLAGIFLLSVSCGFGLAVIGLIRKEKFILLSLLGLLSNGLPILWLFAH